MTTNYVGSQQVNRSAYAVTTETPGTIYLGHCQRDDRPVRFDFAADLGPLAEIPCPECSLPVTGERLHAVKTHLECDGACRSARRASCDCGCGGVNHGNTWTAGALLSSKQVVESALVNFRSQREAAKQRTEAKRTERREREARKAKATFDSWAAGHADLVKALEAHRPDELGYPQEGSNSFLADIARQVHREHNRKPLTDGQLAAAERVLAGLEERRAREAKWAEEKAATPAAPSGIHIPVDGEIVKIKAREGYQRDSVQLQAVVKTEAGYAVQVTLPAKVQDWARDNRAKQVYPPAAHYWRHTYRDGPDYEGVGQRWTDALKGSRLAFTAKELTPWEKDPTLAFAKSPVKVEFTPADYEAEAEQEQRQVR